MITWNELENVLQDTLQAVADGKIIFNPNGQKLQELGLVDMMPASLTLYPGRDFRLTPAGRECYASRLTGETPAGEAVDDDATLFLQSLAQRDQDVVRLEADLAAALARAQVAEGEAARLREEMEAEKPSYGYTVSIVLPDDKPDTMQSKGIDDHDALALARIILERDYKDYPVKIVGISRVIF